MMPESPLGEARALLAADPVAAARRLRGVVKDDPHNAAAWDVLGQVLSAMTRPVEAVTAFQQAVVHDPSQPAYSCNLSVALLRSGDAAQARDVAASAARRHPAFAPAHTALGHALAHLGCRQEAEEAFGRALALDPAQCDPLLGVARLAKAEGALTTAVLALQRAAAIAPGTLDPLIDLGTAYRELGEYRLADDCLARALSIRPGHPGVISNRLMGLQYDPDTDATIAAAAAREAGQAIGEGAVAVGTPHLGGMRTEGPLRVGYMGADFYRHPVMWLGISAIEQHDPDRVHVTVYNNGTQSDGMTARLKSAVAQWRDIHVLDDMSVCRQIREDGIDVLVDLSGHTGGNRLPVFARRPAPVQVSWLGYFATTGLCAMDRALFDDEHCPPGTETLFTEELVRLPRLRFAYTLPEYAPPVAECPKGEADGRVTFGCFNNAAKINAKVIGVWARVLTAVPDSVLVLKWRSFADPFLRERIEAAFMRHGVAQSQLVFEGAEAHDAMLARYGAIDIALDPFPFTGGVTTFEAIAMGVPVVTLAGDSPVGRQGAAILKSLGRAAWIAISPEEYVRIATDLAADTPGHLTARQELRRQLLEGELCDGLALARALEAGYKDAAARR